MIDFRGLTSFVPTFIGFTDLQTRETGASGIGNATEIFGILCALFGIRGWGVPEVEGSVNLLLALRTVGDLAVVNG